MFKLEHSFNHLLHLSVISHSTAPINQATHQPTNQQTPFHSQLDGYCPSAQCRIDEGNSNNLGDLTFECGYEVRNTFVQDYRGRRALLNNINNKVGGRRLFQNEVEPESPAPPPPQLCKFFCLVTGLYCMGGGSAVIRGWVSMPSCFNSYECMIVR